MKQKEFTAQNINHTLVRNVITWEYSECTSWINALTEKSEIIRRSLSCTLYDYTISSTIGEVTDLRPYKIVAKIFRSN